MIHRIFIQIILIIVIMFTYVCNSCFEPLEGYQPMRRLVFFERFGKTMDDAFGMRGANIINGL